VAHHRHPAGSPTTTTATSLPATCTAATQVAGSEGSDTRDRGPDGPSDAALVALARRDPLAFAPLYQRYVAPVYRYCYRQTSDPDVAADLTAQIFTRALEALPRFTIRDGTGGTFRSWLFAIAHNAVIDARRRHRPVVPLDDSHDRLADNERGPEDRAVLRDELHRLIAVLDRIPDSQRQIIELRLAGLTATEIATALGMSRPAVKAAQTRAYARLRALLSPRTPSSDSPVTHPEPPHDRA
jgi:RNA polymerase sigma-70 factor (ECF subfamily)